MLGNIRRDSATTAALVQIEQWTRQRFRLADTAAVVVAELECALPGCPPLETVVTFWTSETARHHFKVFKPASAVVQDDLPYAWLLNALLVRDGIECECC